MRKFYMKPVISALLAFFCIITIIKDVDAQQYYYCSNTFATFTTGSYTSYYFVPDQGHVTRLDFSGFSLCAGDILVLDGYGYSSSTPPPSSLYSTASNGVIYGYFLDNTYACSPYWASSMACVCDPNPVAPSVAKTPNQPNIDPNTNAYATASGGSIKGYGTPTYSYEYEYRYGGSGGWTPGQPTPPHPLGLLEIRSRLVRTDANPDCYSGYTSVSWNVICYQSGDPTSATATPSSICAGTGTTLTLNGGGGGSFETIAWYTSSCGGTLVGTGNNLVVNPTITTTYWGRYEDGAPCTYYSACASVTVTVYPLPIPAISGPNVACVNSSGNVYSTLAGMTGYSWTVSAGGNITAGSGTNSITVTWNTAGSQNVYVTYTDGNGCTAASPSSYSVIVVPLPTPTISGPNNLCAGTTGNVYSTESGMTGYNWTVSAGGNITAGTGTNSITVTWNTAGAQTVTVNYLNVFNCTAAGPTSYPVTVNPKPVPTITGPASPCINSTGNVYTTEGGMTSYVWSVSGGGIITAGGTGNSSVTVTWNTLGPQTVSVSYINAFSCTTATPTVYNVTVNALPVATATPSSQAICSGAAITPIVLTSSIPVTDIITNGGFETASFAPWVVLSSSPPPSVTNAVAHSGTYSAFVGSPAGGETPGDASFYQTITVPAGGGTLSYWYYPVTTDWISWDWQDAYITNTSGVILATIMHVCSNANAWTQVTYDMSAFAGQTVRVEFLVHGDNAGDWTYMYVDDVTLLSGTTFAWTRDNTATVTGIAASGTGNISGNLTNTTSAPVTVTFTITPTANGCPGTPITATVLVNPTPNAIATPASQMICSGSAITTIVLTSSTAGTTYAWTRDNTATVTGIAASGTGNISGSLTNTTSAPVAVTFTITPTANGCVGPTTTAIVTVNPIPDVNPVSNQVVCNGVATAPVTFSGSVPGTTFNWTNTTPSIGLAASGTGNIGSFTATNSGTTPVVATVNVTPEYSGGLNFSGSLVAGDATMSSRLFRDAVASTCASPKSYPGSISSGPYYYDTYTFTNTTGSSQCVSVTYDAPSGGDVFLTAYNGTFNPASLGTNYLADGGNSSIGTGPVTFSFTVANGATIVLVANVAFTGTTCPAYTITVTGMGIICTGTPTSFTYTVNPTPNAVATPSSQTICSGSSITAIALSGSVAGTTYNWTRDNTATVTGIAASGSGNISGSLTNTTFAPVTVTFTITPTANGCVGPTTTATVLVNPTPNAIATPSSQTICSAASITTIALTSSTAGTTYTWTRDNTATVTGIAASGSGNISGSLTNTTLAPVTVTFTITPTANGCVGPTTTATVLVNPTPNAVATPSSQTICSGSPITTIAMSGSVSGTTYAWTRDNTATVTGIAASGSGNISGSLTNTTFAPVTVTFTITPTANGCAGTPITATVLVNPTPNAIATPSSQTICSSNSITTIVLTSSTSGTTYTWTRDNTATVTGIAASGSGNISGSLTNTTALPVTVTFTITPTANSCVGATITATVLVNPGPIATPTPASQTICSGNPITTIVLSSGTPGTTYTWTRDNTVSVTGIAASGSGNISGSLTNTTFAPVTVTFTITPTASGCVGPTSTATVTVNPTPVVNPVSSQVVCNGAATTPVTFTGPVAGTIFNWTNTTPSIGLAASGTGNIGSFTAVNAGIAPVVATVTVTPQTTGTTTQTFNYTGGMQTWTVPAGVTSVNIETYGAEGGTGAVGGNSSAGGAGGKGSKVTGTLAVTPGQILYINVGSAGGTPTAGYNGGGTGGSVNSGGGGGASDIRYPTNGSSDRFIIAGGGGGGGRGGCEPNTVIGGTGGNGDGNGTNGANSPNGGGGFGGVGTTGGLKGIGCAGYLGTDGAAGTLALGGNGGGGQSCCCFGASSIPGGGGGGGGYLGGGGGGGGSAGTTGCSGNDKGGGGGGAGGTSWWSGSITGGLLTTGVQSGNGLVKITYSSGGVTCTGTPTSFTYTVNPTPNAVAAPAAQTVCTGTAITTIVISGNVAGTTFNWTRDNNATVTGIAASGSGNISGTLNNIAGVPTTVTFTITPTANGCNGPAITATVLVNPSVTIPVFVAGPTSVRCQGAGTVTYTATASFSTGMSYTLDAASLAAGCTINGSTGAVTYTAGWVGVSLITAYASGCNGPSSSWHIATTNPRPMPTITGPASACAGSAGNIYTTEPGMTGYTWTVSAGGSITSGGLTNSILVTWNTAGAQTVSVNYTNGFLCPALVPTVYNVTVNPLPIPTIAGPATACVGSTGNVYTTQAGMTGYAWTVSAGGSITAGAGTSAITVTWNTAGAQTVSVTYTNASGCTAAAPAVYNVTVNTAPVPTITGSTSLCVNSGYYNYTTEAGMTNYVWTVSAGGLINWGSGTNQIQVSWIASGAQTVSVNYTSATGCAAVTPTVLNVMVNPLPDPAGSITGTAAVCGGATGVAYSTPAIPGTTTYVWTLPSGATIASGAGTNSITVNFAGNASSGNITVYGNNICGNGATSPPFPVTVTALPDPAGTITGPASVCQGDAGKVYTVPAIPGATGYVWSLPAGAAIVAGNNTNSITVDFAPTAVSGIIVVAGTNSCGSGTVSPDFILTVNPVPPTPVVTNTGYIVSSSAATGNQWYYSATATGTGAPISGATGQTYDCTLTGTGYYWVVVTVNGCPSAESNRVLVITTGIEKLSSAVINLFPVPNDGRFTVTFSGSSPEIFTISIFNNLGVKIFEDPTVEMNGMTNKVIDLRPVPNGVYTVIFHNSQKMVVKKIVVNK